VSKEIIEGAIEVKSHNVYLGIIIIILITTTISFVGCEAGTSSPALPSPSPFPSPSKSPSPSPSSFCVCLDPGHPSENNDGATVYNGLTEVKINWQVAQLLAILLREQGISVVMTKDYLTQNVTNQQRALIANQAKANLFVRLHCDSGGGPGINGITFYYPDRQGTKDGKTGPSPEIIERSKQASLVIHPKTVAKLGDSLHDNGIKGESVTLIGERQGALTGSIYSDVPVITVEMVFLDNEPDARFIGRKEGREKMAAALNEGIMAYLGR
jgi:N-acetylmuramoyl-L-alanine amidase